MLKARDLDYMLLPPISISMDSSLNQRNFYSNDSIKSGDLVIEYTGEVIRRALADIREK